MNLKEENTIKELKENWLDSSDELENLKDTLDELQISLPYVCYGCNKYMVVNDYDEFRNETFDGESNTWNSQRCDCCPMCAKKEWLDEMVFRDTFGRPYNLSDVPMTMMSRKESFEKQGGTKKDIDEYWKNNKHKYTKEI